MQSSRVRLLVALLVVMATGLYLARSLRWVPADRQEVVRQGRETVAVLGPGVHLLPVGARERIRYPAGEWTYVFPAEEDFRVLDARSLDTEVGLRTTLRIPEGSAEEIRRLLGADMEAALELTLQRLVSRHAASVPAEADRASLERLAAEVSRTVGEILAPTGIEVTGCEVTRWVPLGEGGAGPLDLTLASERPLRRVVLVGVDGADWTIIDPLIEAGKLPNFARLRREGATGDLRSFEPLLSPLLWTTMATGKLPEEHGVLDFNVTDPATGEEVPVNRLHRRVDAMWNVLSDYGRSVAVIGWLATHPPEPVDGIVISDRLGLIAQGHVAARRLDVTDVVQPASRAEMVESALVRHPDLQYSDVRAFANVDEDLFRRSRDLEPGADRLLSNFLSLYAAARTYQGVTMELLEQSSFDFLTVYQDFVDASCHLFMPAAPPRREEVSDEEFARYRGAVEAVYREQDRMLGEVMARCGEGTLLMIVSDHGFKSGSARLRGGAQTWTGKAPLWHRLEGVVAFWGDGVRPGARLA